MFREARRALGGSRTPMVSHPRLSPRGCPARCSSSPSRSLSTSACATPRREAPTWPANADRIVRLERLLGIDWEHGLQTATVDDTLVTVANWVYISGIGRHPLRGYLALPPDGTPLRPVAERDVRLGPGRLPALRGLPRRAAAPARPRARRHRHRALGRLSRPPATRPHEPVRGISQPARRLEPSRRDRAPDGGGAHSRLGSSLSRCRCDGPRRDRDGEPLRHRRPGGIVVVLARPRDRIFRPGRETASTLHADGVSGDPRGPASGSRDRSWSRTAPATASTGCVRQSARRRAGRGGRSPLPRAGRDPAPATVGPLPIYWDRWTLASPFRRSLVLAELLRATDTGIELMLDLKGGDRAGEIVRAESSRT